MTFILKSSLYFKIFQKGPYHYGIILWIKNTNVTILTNVIHETDVTLITWSLTSRFYIHQTMIMTFSKPIFKGDAKTVIDFILS